MQYDGSIIIMVLFWNFLLRKIIISRVFIVHFSENMVFEIGASYWPAL